MPPDPLGVDVPPLSNHQFGDGDRTPAPQALLKQTRNHWILLAIGLLVLLMPFSTTFQHGGGPMDEGTLLVYPELIQHGAIPYRDFETFYGPANPYVLAGVYKIFGTNIAVERSVGLFYRAIILVALFALTRRWGNFAALGCMLIAGGLLLPLGVVAYAWLGAVACALCFVSVMSSAKNDAQCVYGGILTSLAVSFRPDVGPAVLFAACVLLQPLSWRRRGRFILGAALGLVPFTVLFFAAGPEHVFSNVFVYPVLRGADRRIPFAAADPFLVRLFVAQVIAAAVNVAAAVLALRSRTRLSRDTVLLAMAVLGAGLLPQAWQRLDLYHVLFVAFLTLGILPVSMLTFLTLYRHRSEAPPPISFALGATAVVASIVSIVAPLIPQTVAARFSEALQTAPTGSEFVHENGRSFPVGPPERAVIIGRMLDKVEQLSKPGDRLFVGPNDLRGARYCDTFLYHLMPKLQPATYFLEMNPGSANRPGSRLASDIEGSDWVILNSEWTSASEANGVTAADSDKTGAVIRDHFRPVGRYGSFTLFARAH